MVESHFGGSVVRALEWALKIAEAEELLERAKRQEGTVEGKSKTWFWECVRCGMEFATEGTVTEAAQAQDRHRGLCTGPGVTEARVREVADETCRNIVSGGVVKGWMREIAREEFQEFAKDYDLFDRRAVVPVPLAAWEELGKALGALYYEVIIPRAWGRHANWESPWERVNYQARKCGLPGFEAK